MDFGDLRDALRRQGLLQMDLEIVYYAELAYAMPRQDYLDQILRRYADVTAELHQLRRRFAIARRRPMPTAMTGDRDMMDASNALVTRELDALGQRLSDELLEDLQK